MTAQCIEVTYEAGEFQAVPSYGGKNHPYTFPSIPAGASVVGGSNGWIHTATASRLILKIRVEGAEHEVWIDRFFKKKLGRLTQKRQEAIIRSMPATITVTERLGQRGTKYFAADEHDLQEWGDRIGA